MDNLETKLTQELIDLYRTQFNEAVEARKQADAKPDSRDLNAKANILRNRFQAESMTFLRKALEDDKHNTDRI